MTKRSKPGVKKARVPSDAYKKKPPRVRRRKRPTLFVSPEWRRACEDVVAAFAAQEIRAFLHPFGAAGDKLSERAMKRAMEEAVHVQRAVTSDLEEAMHDFDAKHPPCPRGPRCMHYALLDVAAHNAFEDGRVENPTVSFRLMRAVVDRYMNRRS